MSADLSPEARSGLYVHIPFCVSKCLYCDFSSYTGLSYLHAAYVTALLRSIETECESWEGPPFDSLYIGGGTPTALPPEALCGIIDACVRQFALTDGAEITCEANPGTVTLQSLQRLRTSGVSRLSLGAQSFDNVELTLLGRIHDRDAIVSAVADARLAEFDNISLDLIYGLPGQGLPSWRRSLQQAVELEPEHLSLYALTLEPGTPLAECVRRGALPDPDDDAAADMYALAQDLLHSMGYVQYEISNWARQSAMDAAREQPLLASRHNLHYWHNERYLGLGSAAYSYDGRRRFGRVTDPAEFIRRTWAGQDTVEAGEPVTQDLEMDETLMLGLRLMRGVSWAGFAERFGRDLRSVYAETLSELRDSELLINDETGIRLAPGAYLVANRVLGAFLRPRA